MNIVTGFGPFGTVSVNPSSALARAVAGNVGARFVELSTSYARSMKLLRDVVDDEKPEVLLLFGYAKGVDGLRVETVGRNVAGAAAPDIDGVSMLGRAQESSGPDRRLVTFDADQLAREVADDGVSVATSTSAGGYVCNWVLYGALGMSVSQVAFVHVGDTTTDDLLAVASAVYNYLGDESRSSEQLKP